MRISKCIEAIEISHIPWKTIRLQWLWHGQWLSLRYLKSINNDSAPISTLASHTGLSYGAWHTNAQLCSTNSAGDPECILP